MYLSSHKGDLYMPQASPQYLWMNGQLVPYQDATIHVSTAAAFYATNVFEGIRIYWNGDKQEAYAFRLREHFTRWFESMKMMRFSVPYTPADLEEALREVIKGNNFKEDVHGYLVAYVDAEGLTATTPVGVYLNFRRRGRIAEASNGMHCCITSWVRTSDNAIPIRLKCGANYQNGRLASLQATVDGYDGPIFLNSQGHVAEGSGASFFMVRKGEVLTPPATADILESINRVTLMQLFKEEMGLTVKEQEIDRTQVYVADEAFFCGSGYEVTPILSVDRFSVGDGQPGPITQEILQHYLRIVRGTTDKHTEWRTPMYQKVLVTA
jgi:branched-chain amino acid aminotransferase